MSDLKTSLKGKEGGKHGTRYEAVDMEDMPRSHRKCTDIICWLIFVSFWIGLLGIGGYSIGATDSKTYQRITKGMQYDGKICGSDSSNGAGKHLKYMYWIKPSEYTTLTLCVDACPGSNATVFNLPATDGNGQSVVASYPSYRSKKLYHFCIPNDDGSSVLSILAKNVVGEIMTAIGRAWPAILAALLISVLMGFFFLMILRFLGACFVWGSILAIIVGGTVVGYLMFHKSTSLESGSSQKKILMAVAILVWIATFIFICIVIAIRKSIQIATACIREATKAITAMKTMLFLPPAKFGIILFVLFWTIMTMVFIATAGNLKDSTVELKEHHDWTVETKKLTFNTTLRYMLIYTLWGLVWSCTFVMAMGDIIIAGAVATWYFTPERNGERRMDSPVSSSVGRATKYHIGSAAFGSFILTLLIFIRWILKFLHKKLNGRDGTTAILKVIVCCCLCCVECMERCIKFLERQAYIQLAIFGKSFFASGKDAYNLIARNLASVGAINMIGGVYLLLGRLLVVVVTLIFTYLILVNEYPQSSPDGVNPTTPMIISGIIAYFVAAVFMQVFDMSINTILHCFITDREAHGGHPRFCGPDSYLHGIVGGDSKSAYSKL